MATITGTTTLSVALTNLLARFPAKRVRPALPDEVLELVEEEAVRAYVQKIQVSWDLSMCMKLKGLNSISRRAWNRLRYILAHVAAAGGFERLTYGKAQILGPMLPEHRHLVTVMRENDDDYLLKLGGSEQIGGTAYVDLFKCLAADAEYAFRLGHLVVSEQGQLLCKNGETPRCQFKVDAARLFSNAQQSAMGYVLVNACTNPNSPGHDRVLSGRGGRSLGESRRKHGRVDCAGKPARQQPPDTSAVGAHGRSQRGVPVHGHSCVSGG